ncbi:MAG TPA: carboxyl transferase domain-containing protein [Phycisphaerales bacterium]|nr:carboxyl transferase domain-containing protein [Phycisphaerales bacterium]
MATPQPATPANVNTTPTAPNDLRALCAQTLKREEAIRLGGGQAAIDRQHEKGRLTARERIALLVDGQEVAERQSGKVAKSDSDHSAASPLRDCATFQELGLWAADGMYKEFGGAPAAGVVTGIGVVHGRRCMIIANDATVKAGAFFPMTCKKIIRAQTIAMMARLPLIYLVDSAGVFLPLQEDVFPDTDDFGRIFRNNAVLSAMGVPQIAAIMGYCVAGGGYLPVLCDTLVMTEGSGLYLAGPALVKAAIGQEVTDEELGGASMHMSISGTIDFKEKSDEDAIERVRSLVSKYEPVAMSATLSALERVRDLALTLTTMYKVPSVDTEMFEPTEENVQAAIDRDEQVMHEQDRQRDAANAKLVLDNEFLVQRFVALGGTTPELRSASSPYRDPQDLYGLFTDKAGSQYDVRDIIACIVDAGATKSGGAESLAPDFDEYKAEYGQSIVCGYATIGGHACGIVASQKKIVQRTMPGGKAGPSKAVQMPGVIYDDSADKAARFIMDCNQRKIPIVFLHDTTGFMVGRDSEQGGIIRAGAKMVNAMSNCVVPKIVVITGGSYGAGNYAMCGRAFDQFLAFAWPSAKCAVMGANQATGVLTQIEEASRKRKGETIDAAAHEKIYGAIHAAYTEQAAITHAAARGWVDRIIEPHKTREELIAALDAAAQGWDYSREFKTGVLQV